jgi:hypothetical protein
MLSGRVLNATRQLGAPAEWTLSKTDTWAVFRLLWWVRRG